MKNYKAKSKTLRDKWITDSWKSYDEKYLKLKFNLDGNLYIKGTLKFYKVTIVVRSVFHEGNKYYSQFFLEK